MKPECVGDSVKLNGKSYPCTVSLTMNLIGGKWKAVILYHLRDSGKRFSELKNEIPTVTEMTISLQLKQLEKDGLIIKEVFGKKPPLKVVYHLSDFGKSLIPLLDAITDWGNNVVIEKGEFITETQPA